MNIYTLQCSFYDILEVTWFHFDVWIFYAERCPFTNQINFEVSECSYKSLYIWMKFYKSQALVVNYFTLNLNGSFLVCYILLLGLKLYLIECVIFFMSKFCFISNIKFYVFSVFKCMKEPGDRLTRPESHRAHSHPTLRKT